MINNIINWLEEDNDPGVKAVALGFGALVAMRVLIGIADFIMMNFLWGSTL